MSVRDTTLGVHLRGADFPELSVAEVRYAPKANLASHAHEFTYLSLVLRGGFEERVGTRVELASSASVVVMPSGITHGEHIGPFGARSVTIALKPAFLEKMAGGQQQLGEWRWFHGGPVTQLMLSVYREHLLADEQTGLGLCELFLELLGVISREHKRDDRTTPRCLRVALELLHTRDRNGVRLGDLAADVGKDPAYLARAFRRRMGCTMSEYRRRLWVRQAAHLLAATDTPLGQVALAAGFADQSHLCRVFKAVLGFTPQAYRNLIGPR